MNDRDMAKSATLLAAAGMVEYGLQVVLPMLLVRYLTPEEFGEYRLLWLLATTAVAVFPLFMPQTLFYFLPRAVPGAKARLFGNTLMYLLLAGLAAALLLVLCWPLLPESIRLLGAYSGWVPLFVGLWVVAALIDVLPTADGRPVWQAAAVIFLAGLRTLGVGLVAILTRDLGAVLMAVCAFALVRLALVPLYVFSAGSERKFGLDWPLFGQQLAYSWPFAVGNSLFLLRLQADQWIVSAYFPPTAFALVSIAGVVLAVSTLVKQPIRNTILPEFSELVGHGNLVKAQALLQKSNAAIVLLVTPVLALLIVIAEDLVHVIYTATYRAAAPLMQIMLAGEILGLLGAGYLLSILRKRRLSIIISALGLTLSVTLCLLGIYLWGLNGAVVGSVLSMLLGETWTVLIVAREIRCRVIDLVPVSLIGPVLLLVLLASAAGMLLGEFLLAALSPMARLLCVSAAYVSIMALGIRCSGMWRSARTLLRPARA